MKAGEKMAIVDPILSWGERQPHAPAISDGLMTLTYGALAQRIEILATVLGDLGVTANDRVMLIGENSIALAVLILATSFVGAVAVLENARRAPYEIDAIQAHCCPKRALFVMAHSPDAAQHAERLNAQIMTDPVIGDFGVSASDPAGHLDGEPEPDLATLIYTTGTTGKPKGVMLTHASLCYIASMMPRLRGISTADNIYGILPITHVMGQASVFLGGLHAGAHLHLRARFSASTCLRELTALNITALQGATAMFAKLAEQAALMGWGGAPGLRFIGAGGAPIDPTVKKDTEIVFGLTLHNGYGLTEAASTCWTRFEDNNVDESVGRPLPGLELRVTSADGVVLPANEIGELWVRGANVMRGYFRDPQQTAAAKTPDGWFNTHDLARIAPDGRVFIVGRAKDVIIRSGFKVNPLEVEAALNQHPAIAHSAVVGRPVPANEEVVAFVELKQGISALPDDLETHLRGTISSYKHPSEIIVLPTLPLAPNGKVLKAELVRRARER